MTALERPLPLRCPICGGGFDDATFCPRDGAKLETQERTDDPYIGMVVSGDIELRNVAGTGAMGRVYRAWQRSIDRDVAVKILHRELSGNAQLVRRFHREAKIASKLRHPHVVDMHMVGQLEDGSLYIVMEYLDGSSLADTLTKSQGPLATSRAIGIALQAAGAVGEGHTLGIVHRDLKPENVMLVNRGAIADWVKVLDFGIARVEIGDQSMETAAGGVLGTARYISPEGAAGLPVGPPGDVYALATMLYQMLAGRTPFDAVAPMGLLVKHVHEAPPPLHAFALGVPDSIHKVVMDNLAKDPEHRAPTGRAFAAQLSAAVGNGSPGTIDAPYTVRSTESHGRVSAVGPTLLDSTPPPRTPRSFLESVPKMTTAPLFEPPPLPPPSMLAEPPSTMRSDGTAPRSRTWPIVLGAFVVGAAISAAIAWRVASGDRVRADYVEHARNVLADGHYVTPPGDNVNELVRAGLQRWPGDGELAEMRSQAEQEMITMAMAAQASGDIVGVRYMADSAFLLDPTDNSARMLRAQAADSLAALTTAAGLASGPPRVAFDSPPVVGVGAPVTMTAQLVAGVLGPKAAIEQVKITVVPNGETAGEVPVRITFDDPTHVRFELNAPGAGSWDITFEAVIGGVHVRAMRDLDVTR